MPASLPRWSLPGVTRGERALRSNIVGYLFPAYASYKVILSRDVEKYRHWLTYWCAARRSGAGAPRGAAHGRRFSLAARPPQDGALRNRRGRADRRPPCLMDPLLLRGQDWRHRVAGHVSGLTLARCRCRCRPASPRANRAPSGCMTAHWSRCCAATRPTSTARSPSAPATPTRRPGSSLATASPSSASRASPSSAR